MIRHGDPTCAACGAKPQHGLFCRTCWKSVPLRFRKAVEDAWKVYLARPGSLKARHDYELAIAEAVEAIA